MTWREKFLIYFGSSYFFGITPGEWFGLLRENRFAIAPECLLRAGSITFLSAPNGVLRWPENARYRKEWERIEILPPLFVLGYYRCGTTHLHNLLAVDNRFAYPNAYQATYPHTFLITERMGSRIQGAFVPETRPFDNVRLGFDVPYEDEIALTNATRTTSYMALAFPRRQAHHDRFLTFRNATIEEISRWREGLLRLLRKLTLKYGKPLVLKSPPHTCRIKLLLDTFPKAKFVHIHRDPYVVIQSTLHLMRVGLEWIRLQNSDCVDWTERELRQWREMYDAYLAEKHLIPAGCLHEIAFADLERDPIGELRQMYAALRLPPFEQVEPRVKEYVASIADYEKNKFAEIPADLKARIREYCGRGFDEWGYQR